MAEEQNSGCSPESCSSCAHAGSCSSAKKDLKAPANPYSQVKKVIGVVSGKGGVGKSMVTASLARMMVQQGYSVGILDADITGPSIPKMYGVHGSAVGSEAGMFPCVAKDGTKIMSVNLLLEHDLILFGSLFFKSGHAAKSSLLAFGCIITSYKSSFNSITICSFSIFT